jgi:hypothetical protein
MGALIGEKMSIDVNEALLAVEIDFARRYATTEGDASLVAANNAETRVRAYFQSHSCVPERTTTIAIARDAAESVSVTFFAVGDVGAHDGFVTSRVTADIWTGQNPGGWTYQDVTGAHGTILHEGTENECRTKLDSWLQCSDDRCYTHGHAA